MTKVLMVCLGNICRSPLAEGILKSKTDSNFVFVDSAGTGGYHIGNPPDKRSIAVAKKHGIDISQQSCRQFSYTDFAEFDHIYVMDKNNYVNVISKAKNETEKQKVRFILSEQIQNAQEVPDPYYGGVDGFENVFQLINSSCDIIAKKLTTYGNQ